MPVYHVKSYLMIGAKAIKKLYRHFHGYVNMAYPSQIKVDIGATEVKVEVTTPIFTQLQAEVATSE